MKKATDLDRAIGARLRLARKGAGLSQSALADAIGVSFQQLQKYENGANRIAASTLVRLARALGIAPAALLTEGADEAPQIPLLNDQAVKVALGFQSLSPRLQNLLAELTDTLKVKSPARSSFQQR